MASSSKSTGPYEVFLSFRGPDVRCGFNSHLYEALVRNGIRTFRDNEELRKGQDISILLKAIEESRIAIIVFSEHYASSQWCLEEVAKIMECKQQKGLTVVPVFYKVDPKEVRVGRTSYAEGLAKHESKHGKDSKGMERWKKALWDAGNLVGWTLTDRDDESEVIQEIAKDILTRLCQTPCVAAEHLVGIESRVAEVKSMLNLESKDDVLIVGLWGQGGIGKTTLARAIYNDISKEFDGSSFLANVRENSNGGKNLVTLQEKLLNDILLPPQDLKVSDDHSGKNLIRLRLCHKRVLVILDDVDRLNQLHALAEEGNWFGNGSRILVTTRDSHLLIPRKDKCQIYEVKALGSTKARKLLSKHAFPPHQKLKIRADLVDRVLDHAKGIPLALEVLGSFLCGRREGEWKSTLERLSRIPMKDINDVLKISYDGLEENEKEIFLYVACFFKGWKFRRVEEVLNSCGLNAEIGLKILIERSLIGIGMGLSLQVHDLIQTMGKDIVKQESDDPEGCSRLWLYEDVLDVLSRDLGNCRVKAVVLEPPEQINICGHAAAFAKMRMLRLLILHNISFQSPIYLPNGVISLEWPDAPSYPEFSSGPKKLVRLEMPGGGMTFVPKPLEGFQKLKYVNFSGCESLVCTPDISCTPNLEELDLSDCKNLIEAHESIADHDKLQVLNLGKCSELSVFPNVLKSKNLRDLNLERCTKFERFPDIPHELESLEMIDLWETAIKGLPASIENLVSLEGMFLGKCKSLVNLPPSIYKLQKLERLVLWDCTNLIEFPRYEDSADLLMKTGLSSLGYLDLEGCNLSDTEFFDSPSCFTSLTELRLPENNISCLPTSFNKLDPLSSLDVKNCHQLQEIPGFLKAACYESLQNRGDLTSVHDFVRRALNRASSIRKNPVYRPVYYVMLPGGEMPEWIVPVEGHFIYFMVSKDLYDKFLGFALFVSYGNDEQKWNRSCGVSACVNGKGRESFGFASSPQCYRFELNYYTVSGCFREDDFIWPPFTSYRPRDIFELDYYIESVWRKRLDDDFSRNYDFSRHAIFSLAVYGEGVEKWGIRIICKRLDDDPRVVPPDNRLINPALIYEVSSLSTDSEAESSLMHKKKDDLKKEIQDNQLVDPVLLWEIGHDSIDSEGKSPITREDCSSEADPREDLQDCQMSIEEGSQIVPKRNHKLILSQGTQTKMVLTSNSIGRYENGGVGLQLLLE